MFDRKPTITIAIPSYNKEKYIERCIDSILVEKNNIEEIILIDNCSTDKTFEIAKKYNPEVKCYKNYSNIGMANNWNKCIDLCKTDWLIIFHADDELLPGSIEKYIDIIKRYPGIGLIHADSYFTINGGGVSKNIIEKKKKTFWKAGLDALQCDYGVCSAVMVKKDVYNDVGYFINESLSADVEMWARVAGKYDIAYINMPTVIYHVNSSSTGPNSLINRPISEIKKDWDNLTTQIASYYPDDSSRNIFLQNYYKNSPYGYWAVFKANIRVGNF